MKSLRSLLAGTAALVALSVAATGCDASPYAASINGQVIKETALNAELGTWAANSQYVTAFNSSNSSSGVAVTGDAPNTLNATWVANILDGMIRAAAIHQHLVATGNLPSPATLQGTQSVSEISQVGWYQFPAAFRQTLVERTAEAATLQAPSVPAATLLQVFRQYRQYFFSQICTLQASAFNAAQARTVVSSGVSNGNPVCYDQTQLEAQPAAVRTALLGGKAAAVLPPIATGYGYLVIKVVSRTDQAYSPEVQSVLAYAIEQAQGITEPALATLLTQDRVRVDPAYGTWSGSRVVTPSIPGAQSPSPPTQ